VVKIVRVRAGISSEVSHKVAYDARPERSSTRVGFGNALRATGCV
jgi:hypothetical protein